MKAINCIICNKEFTGFGHNPDPVKKKGRCCDDCNMIVLVARMKEINNLKKF